ncbi:MAG: methionine adenosyltransferase, partial [Anaeroplasmataceae bacterium]|nr:methionine adenosyltransferase [Anaeroplasmataceae bacterium]
MRRFFTSESVTEGHPDKIADQISDAILDDILAHDPDARVACETICTTGLVMVFGEITTNHYVELQKIVRKTVADIGYDRGKYGFDAENLAVLSAIDPQSSDIAMGVDETKDHEQGAGDQGIMFGYACNETEEYMPMAITLAHKLARRLTEVRKKNILPYLRPDGKTQVTVEYDENHKVKRIDTVLISTQHSADVSMDILAKDIKREVVDVIIPKYLLDSDTKFLFNPTGRFVVGGPAGDSGLTGRKIIVDTYGGAAPHGGGAFSGKDPSKVDRSASYMARYIAKNIVAAKLADQCQIQLSYAIGVAEPTSILVETFGTSKVSEENIEQAIRKVFPLTPKGIIETLNLKRPIYQQTAAYGHFGRTDIDLPWEKCDKIVDLQKLL